MAEPDAFAKLGAWAKTHRAGVLAGGGAGVAGLALVMRQRSRNASAGGAPPPDAAAATYGAPAGVDAGAGGISTSDAYSMLLQQQSAFQAAVQGELDNRDRMGIAQITGLLRQRQLTQQQRQAQARTFLTWFARRYRVVPRTPAPAAPRPPAPVATPGAWALIAQQAQQRWQALTPAQRQRLVTSLSTAQPGPIRSG